FCRFVIRSDTGEVATENGSPTSSVSEKLVDRYCFRILFLNCDVSPAGVCRGRSDSYSLGYSGFPTPRPGVGGDPSQAGDDGQPGLGVMRIDRDVDLGGLDGVHRPPLGETVAYLFLPDAAGSPVTSLAVAEAEHVVMRADRHRGAKFFREPRAVVVVPERVEEPAIEDRVE